MLDGYFIRINFLKRDFRVYRCWVSQVVPVVKNPPANAGDIRDMNSIPRL